MPFFSSLVAVGLVCFLYSHPQYAVQKKENLFQILNAPYLFNQKIAFSKKENIVPQFALFSEDSVVPKEEMRSLFELTHSFYLKKGKSSIANYNQFVNTLSKSEATL